MDYIAPVAAVLLAGVTVALVLAIGKNTGDARSRVLALAVSVVALTAFDIIITNLFSIYYTRPLWATALLAAGWIGLFAVIIVLTRAIRPYGGKVFLLGSLLLATLVCVVTFLISSPFGAPVGLFMTRAGQIAEANGFTALVPADEELDVSAGLPVDGLPAPEAGLRMDYERFTLQQRRADSPMSESDLKALVALGETPLGMTAVTDDAEISVVSVNGRPAVTATFSSTPPEASSKPGEARGTVTVLVTEIDGVEVRIESRPGVPVSTDELVRIAESLAPLM